MVSKIYLEVHDGWKLSVGIDCVDVWKKFELEKVAIRRLFLENVIHHNLQRC